MPFWSSNPLFLWFSTPLLPIFVTEADNGGGPDGVCYTCFAVMRLLFIRHRGSSSSSRPPRRKLFFFLRAWRGEWRRGMSGKQKQMPLLDYHLSPMWKKSLLLAWVCVCSDGVGVCPLLPVTAVWYLNITCISPGKRPWIILMPPHVQEAPSSRSMIHVLRPPMTPISHTHTHKSVHPAFLPFYPVTYAHPSPTHSINWEEKAISLLKAEEYD